MEKFNNLLSNIDEAFNLLSNYADKYLTSAVKKFGPIEFSTTDAEEFDEIVPSLIYVDDFPELKEAVKLYEEDNSIWLLAEGDSPNTDINIALDDLSITDKMALINYIQHVTLQLSA